MITLATLPQATAQEVFVQVSIHLLTQNKNCGITLDQSFVGEKPDLICKYRQGTLKCAAGCLISDEEYKPDMESKIWYRIIASGLAPITHKELISELQLVHDNYKPKEWFEQLQRVASLFYLNLNSITTHEKYIDTSSTTD